VLEFHSCISGGELPLHLHHCRISGPLPRFELTPQGPHIRDAAVEALAGQHNVTCAISGRLLLEGWAVFMRGIQTTLAWTIVVIAKSAPLKGEAA
jgi:hypothetical protein